ncbi:hypothetical protein MtrunA17_Chr5g0433031 [Medicago truncatula]|uniref:Uncharacterized protein n=1 Tax=Medicago truncatula TaxID=3880 RepID=A0A396HTT8_MEDTR|nr:hypothetical protein MtrunA17_Chr5g0433031 [Medicago truncatula]
MNICDARIGGFVGSEVILRLELWGDSIDCCVVVVYVGYFIPKQQIKAKLVADEYTQTCFHAHNTCTL